MATKKKISAAGYARRSTDMQERSLPDQKAYVEKWAKENGYRICHWYIDDAISGTSTKGRKAFEGMISDAENGGGFEAILCYDISRFSRGGTNETGYFLHRLQMAGVETVFCADGIPDGDEGELLQGVKSWQAKQYTVKLSRDVIRGFISNVTIRHSTPGGPPPFGYDKQHVAADGTVLRTLRTIEGGQKKEFDGNGNFLRILKSGEIIRKTKSDISRYVPSTPERVETVKRIFKDSIAGLGGPRIAFNFNKEGIPTALGNPWTAGLIRDILKNQTYLGSIVWNKRSMGRFHGVDGKGNLRPKKKYTNTDNKKEDWYIIKNVHEPLISPETFEKAQQSVIARSEACGLSRRKKRTNNKSLLSGLVTCVHCGHNFLRSYCKVPSGKETKKFYYYRDSGYSREGYGGKCKLNQIPMFPLNRWAIEQVLTVLLGDKKTTEAAIKQFIAAVRRNEKKPTDTSSLKKKLATVTKRIKATVAMLTDPDFEDMDELKDTLSTLKRQREALQKSLDETDRPDKMDATDAELRKFALKCFADLKDIEPDNLAHDPEVIQLVGLVIDRIEIDGRTKTGTLYLYSNLYDLYHKTLCSYAGRLDFQSYHRTIKNEQFDMAGTVLDMLFMAWLTEARLVLPNFKRISADEILPHQWFFDGNEHVDPQKEANAQKTRLESKTTTLADEWGKQGQDWEVKLEQRIKEEATEQQLRKKYGIEPTTEPPQAA